MVLQLKTNVPSLVELCVQTAIDNIRYISDVGETDIYLLKDILPHCTVDQLMHIEKSSEGRDLSPVTDDLWKRFYEQNFGEDDLKLVIKRLKQYKTHKSAIKWRVLYEAKLKKRNDDKKRSAERLKELYKKESERKQSRQVQICSKIPPSSKKRSFSGGNRFSNVKGSLMKKAKLEYLNSYEVKVQEVMRRKAIQKNNFSPSSVSRTVKPNVFPGHGSASSSKITKPLLRP